MLHRTQARKEERTEAVAIHRYGLGSTKLPRLQDPIIQNEIKLHAAYPTQKEEEAMKCQRCESKRILLIDAKCSDLCVCKIQEHEKDGYVPRDFDYGRYGDNVSLRMCLDCGQVQGTFPHKRMKLEDGLDD